MRVACLLAIAVTVASANTYKPIIGILTQPVRPHLQHIFSASSVIRLIPDVRRGTCSLASLRSPQTEVHADSPESAEQSHSNAGADGECESDLSCASSACAAVPFRLRKSNASVMPTDIAASYIKFVESAGARVVPIHYTADDATLTELVGSVNGVLFAGGSASLSNTSTYYKAGKTVYAAAVKANEAGQHFPLWGTCLGFEELARLLSDSNDRTLYPHHGSGERRLDSENYPVPLVPVNAEAFGMSRMFGGMPSELVKAITTENVTMNNHGAGVLPSDFMAILGGTVEMLSTNVDRRGTAFVSTYEAKANPFYGTQWHPEKNGFEWNSKEQIPHSANAVSVMQWVGNFFVGTPLGALGPGPSIRSPDRSV